MINTSMFIINYGDDLEGMSIRWLINMFMLLDNERRRTFTSQSRSHLASKTAFELSQIFA